MQEIIIVDNNPDMVFALIALIAIICILCNTIGILIKRKRYVRLKNIMKIMQDRHDGLDIDLEANSDFLS